MIGRALLFMIVLLAAIDSHADPYLAVQAGVASWLCQSNECELESDASMLPHFGIVFGNRLDWLKVEVEAALKFHEVHGENGQEAPCTPRCKADTTLYVGTLMVNVWPHYRGFYAGGGIGTVYLSALNNDTWGLALQAGIGYEHRLTDRLSMDLSYRVLGAPVLGSLAGNRIEYVTHGPQLRLTLRFP